MLSKRFPFGIYYEVEGRRSLRLCHSGSATRSHLDSETFAGEKIKELRNQSVLNYRHHANPTLGPTNARSAQSFATVARSALVQQVDTRIDANRMPMKTGTDLEFFSTIQKERKCLVVDKYLEMIKPKTDVHTGHITYCLHLRNLT